MAVSRLSPANVRHPVPAGSRRWGALVLVLVAVFMDLIDITVVVIARVRSAFRCPRHHSRRQRKQSGAKRWAPDTVTLVNAYFGGDLP